MPELGLAYPNVMDGPQASTESGTPALADRFAATNSPALSSTRDASPGHLCPRRASGVHVDAQWTERATESPGSPPAMHAPVFQPSALAMLEKEASEPNVPPQQANTWYALGQGGRPPHEKGSSHRRVPASRAQATAVAARASCPVCVVRCWFCFMRKKLN
jgi:hypothetical protein